MQVHNDECGALKRLMSAPSCDRPADTRSLRLLMRLLLWRWRSVHGGASTRHVSFSELGDLCSDEFLEFEELFAPDVLPPKLSHDLMQISQQARFALLQFHLRRSKF